MDSAGERAGGGRDVGVGARAMRRHPRVHPLPRSLAERTDQAARRSAGSPTVARFATPAGPPVARIARLADRALQGLGAQGTVVEAPAGYGKTTLLAALAAEVDPATWTVCRHVVTPEQSSADALLRGLAATLQAVAPEIGRQALALVDSAPAGANGAGAAGVATPDTLRTAAGLLTADLAAVPGRLLLLLDDCHNAVAQSFPAGADAAAGLEVLLQGLPPGVHLVLAGRTVPRLSGLAERIARRSVLHLTQQDLALRPEEAGAVVDAVLPPGAPRPEPDDVAALYAVTGGWPIALALAASADPSSLDAAGWLDGARRLSARTRQQLFDFLAAEVLDALPASHRQAILALAVLPEVDTLRTATLLGIPLPEASELLRRVAGQPVFLAQVPATTSPFAPAEALNTLAARTWNGAAVSRYRFHDLVRDFLLERLRAESPGRARWLERRAAAAAEATGDLTQAVEHALAGAHWTRAGRLVVLAAPQLQALSQWHTLRRWVATLPRRILDVSPALLLLEARVALFASGGPPDPAPLERAEALLAHAPSHASSSTTDAADAGAKVGRADDATRSRREVATKLALLRAMTLRWQSRYADAASVAQDALSRLDDTAPAVLRARAHCSLALSLHRLGLLSDASEQYAEAAALFHAAGRHPEEADALDGLGLAMLERGHLDQAITYLGQANTLWRRAGNAVAVPRTTNNLGLAHHHQGDLSAAARAFERAASGARAARAIGIEACAWLSLGDVRRDQDNVVTAREHYQRGLELATSAHATYLMRYATAALAYLDLLEDRLDQAEVGARRALGQAREARSKVEEALYARTLALVSLARGERQTAADLLDSAAALLEDAGAQHNLALVALAHAQVAHASRQPAHLRRALEALEARLRALGYHGFLLADARRALAALDYGVAHQMGGARVAALRDAAALAAARGRHARAADATTPSSAPERATAPPDIADPAVPQGTVLYAWAFGRSRVRTSGAAGAAVSWRGAKAKELIFYLLVHPGWQRREEIQACVWSDADESHARQAFHTTLHRLRRTLGADAVEERHGEYRLSPAPQISFDVVEFRRHALGAGDASGAAAAEETEAALALYRGPFLADLSPDWSSEVRDELEGLYLELCVRQANYLMEQDRHSEAEALLRRALDIDPYLDQAHALLITCQAAAGRAAAALHHYSRHAAQLQRDLGVIPSAVVRRARTEAGALK